MDMKVCTANSTGRTLKDVPTFLSFFFLSWVTYYYYMATKFWERLLKNTKFSSLSLLFMLTS
jgi:hypothetical protein